MPVSSVRVSAAASIVRTPSGVYGDNAPFREPAMPGTVVLNDAGIEAARTRVGLCSDEISRLAPATGIHPTTTSFHNQETPAQAESEAH